MLTVANSYVIQLYSVHSRPGHEDEVHVQHVQGGQVSAMEDAAVERSMSSFSAGEAGRGVCGGCGKLGNGVRGAGQGLL